jgi:hypothetical protein
VFVSRRLPRSISVPTAMISALIGCRSFIPFNIESSLFVWVGVRLCTKGRDNLRPNSHILRFSLQMRYFSEWAMLGSNQRPLPCEGSVIACWRFLELAKYLQTDVFLR